MRRKIQRVLDEEINPSVATHGGRIEIVDYANQIVFIKMTGGCQGCASSKATLTGGVEQTLLKHFPQIRQIRDVTDHEAGESPYYKIG